MDFSNEYYEMCSKAQEIQEIRPYSQENDGKGGYTPKSFFEKGDFYTDECDWEKVEDAISIGSYKEDYTNERCYNNTWLPRQDQLLERIESSNIIEKLQQINRYIAYYEGTEIEEKLSKFSFEQILLAFIMEYEFNKKWNFEEKKWIKNV